MKKLFKYGLAIIRNNKLLLCQHEGFDDLIMPGGKKEGNETFEEGLSREISEELNAELVTNSLLYFGKFEDVAAGKKDTIIEMEVYLGKVEGQIRPSHEIKKVVWFNPNDDWELLSAIVKNKILPALMKKGYIK